MAPTNCRAKFFNRRCAACLDAHAGSELYPVKFRIVQVEHRKGQKVVEDSTADYRYRVLVRRENVRECVGRMIMGEQRHP
jgi:hypothetical protein